MTPNSQSPPGLAAHTDQSPDVAVERSHETQSSAETARSEGLGQSQMGLESRRGGFSDSGTGLIGGCSGAKCSCGSAGGSGGRERGGCNVEGCGRSSGGVVAVVPNNLAVTFSVDRTQEQQHHHQQQQQQQQADRQQLYGNCSSRPAVERIVSPAIATPTHHGQHRPRSIESLGGIESAGGAGTRETSSYVWRILVYLAFINPFLCLLCSIWALLVLLAVLITYPLRTFILPKTLSSYPSTPYLPQMLLLHMRMIYPQPTSTLPSPDDFDPIRLAMVHLFGPFLAGIVAAAGWVLVFVWIYTEVLLGEKNDGRGAEYRAVMFVKRKWEEYILVALKPKSLDGY